MRQAVWLVLLSGLMATELRAQSEPSTLNLNVARATSGGIHVYAPEKWALLHINVTNTSPEPREVTVATYFDVEPTLQFGRKVWVPGRSVLHTTQPVLVPKVSPKDGASLNYHSLVFDSNAGSEVLMRDEHSGLINDGAVLINHSPLLTGFIDSGSTANTATEREPYELLIATRLARQLDRRVGTVSVEGLPYDEQSLEAISNLVIVGDRLLGDVAAVAAIRRWMFGGGRVWLMLDRTDPRVLEMLLGDEANCHVIDRVELNSVRIDLDSDVRQQKINQTIEHETPVELARVTASGFDIRASVDGWPAALARTYGHGSLVVTTLGPRGWMTLRTKALPPGQPTSAYEMLPETNGALGDFMLIRNPEFVSTNLLTDEVVSYIGYSIPSRGLIFGFLGGFVVAIGAVGLWLKRIDRIERLLWVVPILGALFGSSLIGIGFTNRHEIAPTSATVQVVQTVSGTDDVVLQGALATYHPEGSNAQFSATQGGRLMPSMKGLQGTTRRMIWTDMGQWHWENVPQTAGQVVVPFSQSVAQPQPVDVRMTLNQQGLVGHVFNAPAGLSDPAIVTRSGRIGVSLKSDGSITATNDQVFGRDQYIAANLLDDEQGRRREVLKNLLTNPQRRDFPDKPQLMAWTPAWDTGIKLSDEYRSRGSALCIFPLHLERPASGQEYVIPTPLLPYRMVARPDGRPSSQIFDVRRYEWRESASYSNIWLQFQIPTELLPSVMQRGIVTLQVSGPIGKLELLGLSSDKSVSVGTLIDPIGTVNFEVSDRSVLQPDDRGHLRLGLNIGDQSRPELTQPSDPDAKPNYWRVESLSLTLWGQAQ